MRYLVFILIVGLACPLQAQEKVVPITKETPAPFTGLLVPEARMVQLLEKEQNAKEYKIRLDATVKTLNGIEEIYQEQLKKAVDTPWYESTSFNRWLGFGLGVAFAVFAVWGASEITNKK